MKMFSGDRILKITRNININGVAVNELCNRHSGRYPRSFSLPRRMLIFRDPVTNVRDRRGPRCCLYPASSRLATQSAFIVICLHVMYLNYESSTAQRSIINLNNVIVHSPAVSVLFIWGFPSAVTRRELLMLRAD